MQAYASRVQGRQILLENPARESKAKKERDEKRAQRAAERAHKAAGVVGKKESRKRGLWKLQKEETKCGPSGLVPCAYADFGCQDSSCFSLCILSGLGTCRNSFLCRANPVSRVQTLCQRCRVPRVCTQSSSKRTSMARS